MKVFISWSGTRSKLTAKLLAEWLPELNNDIKPFVSDDDIAKGGDWSVKIREELGSADFGILCITPNNATKPWVLFEAGALSKQVDNVSSRVAPLLIGFADRVDLPPPLGLFQTTRPTYEDMLKLVASLDETCDPERRRGISALTKAFEVWWPRFETPFSEIQSLQPVVDVRPRPADEVLSEILQVVRGIQKNVNLPHAVPVYGETDSLAAVGRRYVERRPLDPSFVALTGKDPSGLILQLSKGLFINVLKIEFISPIEVNIHISDDHRNDFRERMGEMSHRLIEVGLTPNLIIEIAN